MPQIVLVPTTLRKDEHDLVVDRCTAVGAEVLRIAPDVDAGALVHLLAAAAHDALERPR
jgi:hypothetical protein